MGFQAKHRQLTTKITEKRPHFTTFFSPQKKKLTTCVIYVYQQGPYSQLFDTPRTEEKDNAEELQKILTLSDVSKWDKESGPRLLWWAAFNPKSLLYIGNREDAPLSPHGGFHHR